MKEETSQAKGKGRIVKPNGGTAPILKEEVPTEAGTDERKKEKEAED